MVTIQDGRTLVGQMLAFDKHMNLVLSDTQETRRIKPKNAGDPERTEKRTLGLVILRGETIVSMSIEAAPPQTLERKVLPTGPGIGKPASRGLPVTTGAPAGLGGPIGGIGGPSHQSMAPSNILLTLDLPFGVPPPGFRPGMPMPPPPVILLNARDSNHSKIFS
ncbi:hypothetical protein HK103_007448 [Boothiomyces macroporosus]|uniref:Sm protein B n=1 Tax=Boothiomyces macroporosus TaxID=261099 RepID=A0AAD5UFX3_9FUNG|nr:hypothetical protein HK103_007448 [Boothiomyces macroporosus]